MSKFQEFKNKFEQTLSEWTTVYDSDDKLTELVDYYREKQILPEEFNYLTVVEFDDESSYDSYGDEDSDISLIVKDIELEIFVEFTGTRSSYNGEVWDSTYRQVTPTVKNITVYE